jgi:hypothetical protein
MGDSTFHNSIKKTTHFYNKIKLGSEDEHYLQPKDNNGRNRVRIGNDRAKRANMEFLPTRERELGI